MGDTTDTKRGVDWDAVEPHYRAGIRTLEDIAEEFGCSKQAVIKHARKDGWQRDLAGKIKARADAKVAAEMIKAENGPAARATEEARVEVEAEMQKRVRVKHRATIARAYEVCAALFAELESQTGNLPELEELGEILRNPDDKGVDKLNDIYRAAISLPERSKVNKALMESLRSVVAMEREAYGVGETPPPMDRPHVDPLEAARRIAFTLARGAHQAEQQRKTVH